MCRSLEVSISHADWKQNGVSQRFNSKKFPFGGVNTCGMHQPHIGICSMKSSILNRIICRILKTDYTDFGDMSSQIFLPAYYILCLSYCTKFDLEISRNKPNIQTKTISTAKGKHIFFFNETNNYISVVDGRNYLGSLTIHPRKQKNKNLHLLWPTSSVEQCRSCQRI